MDTQHGAWRYGPNAPIAQARVDTVPIAADTVPEVPTGLVPGATSGAFP